MRFPSGDQAGSLASPPCGTLVSALRPEPSIAMTLTLPSVPKTSCADAEPDGLGVPGRAHAIAASPAAPVKTCLRRRWVLKGSVRIYAPQGSPHDEVVKGRVHRGVAQPGSAQRSGR